MSATPDSALVNPDQRIADLARQLAEREAELAEALEQQTATAEVLQVINASPGDLTPVFEIMLDKAMRLCGASHGELLTYDGERFHTWTLRGFTPAFVEIRRKTSASGKPGSISGRILETKRPVHVLDLMAEDAYSTGLETRRAAVDLAGQRSVLAVPLVKDDRVLGAIMLAHLEVRPFTDKQIALLKNFAGQAVIAMENARLLTETREALEQQTATAEVLQVINSSPGDLKPVFEVILDKAMRLCGASVGGLSRFDGELLHTELQRGRSSALNEFFSRPYRPPEGGWSRRLDRRSVCLRTGDHCGRGLRQTRYRYRDGRFRWAAQPSECASSQRGGGNRFNFNQRRRASGIFREADCAATELRRAGGHRDGKRAATR
jgi:hypothetical protein